MAKSTSRRRRTQPTLPVAALAGFAPLLAYTISRAKSGGVEGAMSGICAATTGWDTTSASWQPKLMWHGTFPVMIGIGVHRLASMFGVNRALARAGIPLLRF